jgi:hypothetical protein
VFADCHHSTALGQVMMGVVHQSSSFQLAVLLVVVCSSPHPSTSRQSAGAGSGGEDEGCFIVYFTFAMISNLPYTQLTSSSPKSL